MQRQEKSSSNVEKKSVNISTQHKHGPYFYAYWKDPESRKLKKKYIGDHMPKNKESNDDYNNKNQIL